MDHVHVETWSSNRSPRHTPPRSCRYNQTVHRLLVDVVACNHHRVAPSTSTAPRQHCRSSWQSPRDAHGIKLVPSQSQSPIGIMSGAVEHVPGSQTTRPPCHTLVLVVADAIAILFLESINLHRAPRHQAGCRPTIACGWHDERVNGARTVRGIPTPTGVWPSIVLYELTRKRSHTQGVQGVSFAVARAHGP